VIAGAVWRARPLALGKNDEVSVTITRISVKLNDPTQSGSIKIRFTRFGQITEMFEIVSFEGRAHRPTFQASSYLNVWGMRTEFSSLPGRRSQRS
jgi:hypothetical protein